MQQPPRNPGDREPTDEPVPAETLELVKRAQGGDGPALDALLDRYQGPVRGLVRKRLGTELRRELDSGDLVQEAMVEVLEGLGRFRPDEGERAFVRWLSVLVENRLRELARYHRAGKRDAAKRVPLERKGPEERPIDPTWDGETPSQEASQREARDLYEQALESLPAAQAELLRLRNTGASWESIAAQVGAASADAARMSHSRAKVALIKALSGSGGEPGGEA